MSLLITILEVKMDQTTMRERQNYSRDHKDIPPFSLVLEFVDLQVHDMENTVHIELKQLAVTLDKKTNRDSYVVALVTRPTRTKLITSRQ